jgi:hypothetical protein
MAFGAALSVGSGLFCYSARTLDHLALVAISSSIVVFGAALRLTHRSRPTIVLILAGLTLAGFTWGAIANRNRPGALAFFSGTVALTFVLGNKKKWLRAGAMGTMILLVLGFGGAALSFLPSHAREPSINFTLPDGFAVSAVPEDMYPAALREDRKVYAVHDTDGVALLVDVGETTIAPGDFFRLILASLPKEVTVNGIGELTTRGVSCPYFDYEGQHPAVGHVQGRYILVPCGHRYALLVLAGTPQGVTRNLSALQRLADSVTGVAPWDFVESTGTDSKRYYTFKRVPHKHATSMRGERS